MSRMRQRAIRGGRRSVFSCIHPKIRVRIQKDAQRFNVFPSFVIATALENFYGEMYTEKFYEVNKRKNGQKKVAA